MQRAILGASLIIFTSCAAFGQGAAESPTFEVASVKPAEPQPMGQMRIMMRGGPGSPDPGQIAYSGVSLKDVLVNAYAVKGYQISGPKWLDSERFDMVAKGGHKLKESVEDDAAAGAAPQGGAAGDAPPPPPGAGYGGAPVMGRMK